MYNRNVQAADAFAKEASNDGLSVSLHQANVGNPGDCQRVVNEVLRQYGRIDYLVNNAGAVHDRTALKMSPLDWEQVIRVNLSGPFYMSQAVLPHFLERGFGRIVNISSYRRPDRPDRPGQLRRRQSRPVRPDQDARPGDGHQGHHRQLRGTGRESRPTWWPRFPRRSCKAVVDTIPMHALGTPEDVAEAVRYLVSDEAHYLTGTLIPVAGGWLMM